MVRQERVAVYGRDGVRGTADPGAWMNRGEGDVRVTLADGRAVDIAAEILRPRSDGGYDMPLGRADLEQAEDRQVLPIAREELRVGKEKVTTGKVVVSKTVQEREELAEAVLQHEDVEVERVPVNRYVDDPEPVREEGDTTIVPVHEEVLVVTKRLVLREEVRIVRHRREAHHAERVTLRSEQARVDRTGSQENAEHGSDASDPRLD